MKWKINNARYAVLGYKTNKYEGLEIELVTVDELHKIQNETPNQPMLSIFGDVVLAKNANDDHRSGFCAYAVLEEK